MTSLLLISSALMGVWLSAGYDVLRVSVLDKALANRLGYIGEITEFSVDPLPHGISRSMLVVVFFAAFVVGLGAYVATVLTRRAFGDPEAIAFALGCGFLGAGAGFAWLATGWPAVEGDRPGWFGSVIATGGVWVPLVFVLISALCLLIWWVHPSRDDRQSDAHSGAGGGS